MHILLYSRAFFPTTGGIETVSLTLAEQIVAAGATCTVVTETPPTPTSRDDFPFAVDRAPGVRRRMALVRSADLVHSNGASLALFAYAKLARKPFIWTHAGYQMVCVDGAGWMDGAPAPLTPLASLRHYARRRGLQKASVQAVKLGLRRLVGRLVDKNVAITEWVAARQPLPNQIVIYNPFPLDRFKAAASTVADARYDFVYVGRLISEKGVETLLRALHDVNQRPGKRKATLLLVGDGERRAALEQLASSLNVTAQVSFYGTKVGRALVDAIAEGAVAVVPSELEEPMGGVALELLAAGRPLIVSARGGLAECVGEAAWTFPNGDHRALAAKMAALLDDQALRLSKAEAARRVIGRFDERLLSRKYLDLYAELAPGSRLPSRQ